MIRERQCLTCQTLKPETVENFNKKGSRFVAHCRPCRSERRRNKWADVDQKDRDAHNERRRDKRKADPMRYRAQEAASYVRNKEAAIQRGKEYREANRQQIRDRQREQYAANPCKRIEAAKHWSANNNSARRRHAKAHHDRNKDDASYRLERSFKTRMWQALSQGHASSSWETRFGYTLGELLSHLEAQFSEGMTWDNYGEWHVDHIRPVSSFDFNVGGRQEARLCWAMSNLQPLWARDNLRKGATYQR